MKQLQQMPLWKNNVTPWPPWCNLKLRNIYICRYIDILNLPQSCTYQDAIIRAWGPCSHWFTPEFRGFVTPGMPWVSDSISETVYHAFLKIMYLTFVTQFGDLNCIAETLQPICGQAWVESHICVRDILQKLSSALQLQNYIFTGMIIF